MTFLKRMLIFVAAALFILVIIVYICHNRKKRIDDLAIERLKEYKIRNGYYPVSLDSIDISADWLYYSTDSVRKSFTLSYPEGIMDVNTVSYNSQTGKWEKVFNY